jgi:hypothetical protein
LYRTPSNARSAPYTKSAISARARCLAPSPESNIFSISLAGNFFASFSGIFLVGDPAGDFARSSCNTNSGSESAKRKVTKYTPLGTSQCGRYRRSRILETCATKSRRDASATKPTPALHSQINQNSAREFMAEAAHFCKTKPTNYRPGSG